MLCNQDHVLIGPLTNVKCSSRWTAENVASTRSCGPETNDGC